MGQAAGNVLAVAGFPDGIKAGQEGVDSHGAIPLHITQLLCIWLIAAVSIYLDGLR